MKVMFLDIDGVLNTSETYIKQREEHEKNGVLIIEIDEFRLEYLKRIIDETDAKIVLSSGWKDFFTKNNGIVIPRTQKGLELYNLFKKYDIEIFDLTSKDIDLEREDEITLWLNNNEVESFVIIDDEPSILSKFIGKELIKTSLVKDDEMLMNMDDCIGLCEEHIEQAIRILNKNNKIKRINN